MAGSSRFLNTIYATDLTVSGETSFSSLDVSGNIVANGTLNIGSSTAANAIIYLNGKRAIAGTDGWLRINDTKAFGSGIYFGQNIIRTDTSIQLGASGASVNMTTSGATFKIPIYMNGTTYKWTTDGKIVVNDVNASTATLGTATADKGIYDNLIVENLRATHQEIDHVANLGGTFLVTPTVKCISSGDDKTLTSLTVTAQTNTRQLSEEEPLTCNYLLTIKDSAFSTAIIGGNTWTQYSEVKVSGTINGVVLGTCNGYIVSINTTTNVLTVAIKYNGVQTPATPSDISTVEEFNIMLTKIYDPNSTPAAYYPVGIWMKARDNNGYSHISLYGGTAVNPTVRIGNLTGLGTVNNMTPSGWGIYTDNGYFSGVIVSQEGKIGGWYLGSDAIYSSSKTFAAADNMYFGASGISLGTTFKVTNAGALTSTSGNIGGWTIGTSDIHSGTHNAWNHASNGLFLGTTRIAGGNGGTWYLDQAGTGKIGRWTFASNGELSTTVSNNTAGMGNNTYAFWAGAASGNAANAPFRIKYDGSAVFTNATIGDPDGYHVTVSNTDVGIFEDATNKRASFGETVIIGKPYVSGADNNESHVEVNYHSLKMFSKEGVSYFNITDLRERDGNASITVSFIGDGESKNYYLPVLPTGDTFSVTVSDSSGGEISHTGIRVSFSTPPTDGAEITVNYITRSPDAKYFTIGSRDTFNGEIGIYSFALGYGVISEGFCSFAEGNGTTASGGYSHAEGRQTTASGNQSHAEGFYTTASKDNSHAEGYETTASGNYSHAEGYETIASGSSSHAEGYYTTASESHSHAEGNYTTASRIGSHAEGLQTTASGYASHAEGQSTTAKGQASHSEGYDTTASGQFSHAQNYYTIATGANQTVIGKFNSATVSGSGTDSDPYVYTNVGDYAFIIGNGTYNTTAKRSNALTVDWNGGIEMDLDVDSSASSSTAATSGTDKDLFNAIISLGWYDDVIS